MLFFYLGWVKVAEALLNPYGDDDDDFECNWFIDRNLQVGLSIVDAAIGLEPPLEKDIFWNDITPLPLYANGALNVPLHVQNGSTSKTVLFVENTIRSTFAHERRLKNQDTGRINPSFDDKCSTRSDTKRNDHQIDPQLANIARHITKF